MWYTKLRLERKEANFDAMTMYQLFSMLLIVLMSDIKLQNKLLKLKNHTEKELLEEARAYELVQISHRRMGGGKFQVLKSYNSDSTGPPGSPSSSGSAGSPGWDRMDHGQKFDGKGNRCN